MSPSNEVRVTIENPHNPIPGEDITATATLTLTKPLSISELTVSIYGRAFSRIDRVYLVRNFQAEWRGQGFFFKRFVVLVQSPTTLPPGTHTFPFKLQLPTSTEQVRGNWHLFNKWKSRDPFPGKDDTHPLPGTMAMGSNQTWGSTDAHIEYIIEAQVKKGPEAGFLASMPNDAKILTVASPPRPDLPQTSDSGPWQQVVRTVQTPSGPVNITCRLPQVLTQRAKIPIYLKSDRSVVLTALAIRVYVVYLVRARSVLWAEKRTNATDVVELVNAENGDIPLTSEYLLVQSPELPEGVPMTFLTFNLACLAHWMEIKYRVTLPGDKKQIKDSMKDISVQVQSWTGARLAQENGSGKQVGGEGRGFVGQVFNEEEYLKWQAEKK